MIDNFILLKIENNFRGFVDGNEKKEICEKKIVEEICEKKTQKVATIKLSFVAFTNSYNSLSVIDLLVI